MVFGDATFAEQARCAVVAFCGVKSHVRIITT
jgi:hypothetical protein